MNHAEGAAAAAAARIREGAKEVSATGKGITSEGAKVLAAAIAKSSSLQLLWLDHNQITDEGAQALAGAMGRSPSLQTIWLGTNLITDEGAEALAEAVSQSGSLQAVWLGDNDISDVGAKALAAATAKSATLKFIDLSNNPSVTTAGESAIADALNGPRRPVRDLALEAMRRELEVVRQQLSAASPAAPAPQKTVMVSYNHAHQSIAFKVRDTLRAKGYSVVIDEEGIHGDFMTWMSRAVNQASAVIVLATREYEASEYCKMEAQLAVTKHKTIIPLIPVGGFAGTEGFWLEIILAGKMWYDVSDDAKFALAMARVLERELSTI